jgi:hypothetical protein
VIGRRRGVIGRHRGVSGRHRGVSGRRRGVVGRRRGVFGRLRGGECSLNCVSIYNSVIKVNHNLVKNSMPI